MCHQGCRILIWIVVVCLAAVPLSVAACLDQSPTQLADKRLDHPIAPRDLTQSEHAIVQQMLKSLEGYWKGQGEEVRCKSSSDPSDQYVYPYKLKGDARTDYYGNLFLKVDQYDLENRTRHHDVFRLYLKQMRFRYENDGGSGDVELLAVTTSEIKFIYRTTTPRGRKPGQRIPKEFHITLTAAANRFAIQRVTYTRGILTGKISWRFQR